MSQTAVPFGIGNNQELSLGRPNKTMPVGSTGALFMTVAAVLEKNAH